MAEHRHLLGLEQDPYITLGTDVDGRFDSTRILLLMSGFTRSSLHFGKRGTDDIASCPVRPPSPTINTQAQEAYPHTGISIGISLSSNSDHTQNDLRVIASFVHKQHQPHSKATSHNRHIPPRDTPCDTLVAYLHPCEDLPWVCCRFHAGHGFLAHCPVCRHLDSRDCWPDDERELVAIPRIATSWRCEIKPGFSNENK